MQWPAPLILHREGIIARVQNRGLFPNSFDEFVSALSVQPVGEIAGGEGHYVLTYRQDAKDEGAHKRVAIHIQGFVRRINLKPYGNWNANR